MNILKFLTPKEQTFYLNSNSSIRQALEKFDYHKFSVVPLVDSTGKYITTVSEGDILRFIKNKYNFDLKLAENTLIEDIERHRSYSSLDINCSIHEVMTLLLQQNFIPIIDDRGMYIGIVKRKDILTFLYDKISSFPK